jgi:hypothetical protein
VRRVVVDAGREPRIGCVLTWPSIGLLFRTMQLPPLIEREGVDGWLNTSLAPRVEQMKHLLAETDLPLSTIHLP